MVMMGPSAGAIHQAEAEGRLLFGGLMARTGARALAAMEWCSSGGLVVAAPTAGSAGILPATLAAIDERLGGDRERLLDCLMTGAVVGLAFAQTATFAAEVGGCQVEVGASAAMAAGAAAAASGGSPEKVFQAAGVTLQNYMGLICDPVKGYVELPCQIRNALAAVSALAAADMVIGGYVDPAPFDETVAAVLATGRMLPLELRATSRGGLAACPAFQDPPWA
jgi:L-serine dehydratase